MALDHGHLRVHLEVHIHVVNIAHLANQTLFYPLDPAGLLSQSTNPIHHLTAGSAVHQLVEGGMEQPPAVPGDNSGGDDRGYIIGGFIAFASDKGDAKTNPCGQRRDSIAAMVPGICTDGRAVHRVSLVPDKSEKTLLDRYHH